MKEIAVVGMTVEENIVAVTPPAPTVTITEVGLPSSKNKAEGKFIGLDQYEFTVTFTAPTSYVMVTPPALTPFQSHKINATAIKNQEGSKKVIRVGDKSTSQTWACTNTSTGATSGGTIYIEITNAGQTKVLAN